MKNILFIVLGFLLWNAACFGQVTAKHRTYDPARPLSLTDENVNISASAGLVRAKLPTINDSSPAVVLTLKKSDTTLNPVCLLTEAGSSIDGQNSAYILSNPWQTVRLQAQGRRWRVLSPAGTTLELILGTPRAVEAARAVASTNMVAAAYTIANQPDVPRNVTVTHTAVSTADTLGTVVVVGTDFAGNPLSETLTPANGTVANGARAFRSITSITGVGWAAQAGNDTVTFGYGSLIGLPVELPAAGTVLGALSTTIALKVTTGGSLASSCVTEASGNGTNQLKVWVPR